MTEDDWITATEPQEMLLFLQNSEKASDRKVRLFAVACSWRVWDLLTDERSLKAVEVAERFAHGQATHDERVSASMAACAAWSTPAEAVAMDAVEADAFSSARNAARHTGWALSHPIAEELRAQATLLRDIFGNPFATPPRIDEVWVVWNDGTIRMLAEAAYELRSMPSGELEPDRLAVLADALEEVGADAALIEHLRGPGPHVRGCWVIDMLIGSG